MNNIVNYMDYCHAVGTVQDNGYELLRFVCPYELRFDDNYLEHYPAITTNYCIANCARQSRCNHYAAVEDIEMLINGEKEICELAW